MKLQGMDTAYDRIGRSYSTFRASDPDIGTVIRAALDGAERVVNVGAGTGSYELLAPQCTAVEPSTTMIAQRPPDSAAVVQATAEQLPFPSGSYDAAMALLTIHHWIDLDRGLTELRRVARRVVILTFDAEVHDAFWLFAHYLPEATMSPSQRPPQPADIAARLGHARVEVVPVPPHCQDGFTLAYWQRPSAYLDPAVRACCSSFADLAPDLVESRMRGLAADLDSGRWKASHADLLGATRL